MQAVSLPGMFILISRVSAGPRPADTQSKKKLPKLSKGFEDDVSVVLKNRRLYYGNGIFIFNSAGSG